MQIHNKLGSDFNLILRRLKSSIVNFSSSCDFVCCFSISVQIYVLFVFLLLRFWFIPMDLARIDCVVETWKLLKFCCEIIWGSSWWIIDLECFGCAFSWKKLSNNGSYFILRLWLKRASIIGYGDESYIWLLIWSYKIEIAWEVFVASI